MLIPVIMTISQDVHWPVFQWKGNKAFGRDLGRTNRLLMNGFKQLKQCGNHACMLVGGQPWQMVVGSSSTGSNAEGHTQPGV